MARRRQNDGGAAGPSVIRDDELVFEVSSIEQLIAEVDGRWKAMIEPTGLNFRQFRDLKQAVVEMGGNALEWGREPGQPMWAQVETHVRSDAVTMVVRDRGPGFNPYLGDTVPVLDVEVSEPEGAGAAMRRLEAIEKLLGHRVGFGIMLAREIVDSLTYNERGNEVTLVKRFGEDPSEPNRS